MPQLKYLKAIKRLITVVLYILLPVIINAQDNISAKMQKNDYAKIKVLKLDNVSVMLNDARDKEEKFLSEFVLNVNNDTLIVRRSKGVDNRSRYLVLSLVNLKSIVASKGVVWIEECNYTEMKIKAENVSYISFNGVKSVDVNLDGRCEGKIEGADIIKFKAGNVAVLKIYSNNSRISGLATDEAEITIRGSFINEGIEKKGNPVISEIK